MQRAAVVVGLAISLCGLAGCGSDSDKAAAPAVTRAAGPVSNADLERDATYWASQGAERRRDLIALGKERLGKERPDVASRLREVDSAQLSDAIAVQFANDATKKMSIYDAYKRANDTLAIGRAQDYMDQYDDLKDDTE